jgi:hypothetical protein
MSAFKAHSCPFAGDVGLVPGPDSTIAAHAQAPKKLPRVSILTTGMETLVAETNSP